MPASGRAQHLRQLLFVEANSLSTPLAALSLRQDTLRRARADRTTHPYTLRTRAHPLSTTAARSLSPTHNAAQEAGWQACQGQGRQGASDRAICVSWPVYAVPQRCRRLPRLMTLTARVAYSPSSPTSASTLCATRRPFAYTPALPRLARSRRHARTPLLSSRDLSTNLANRPSA